MSQDGATPEPEKTGDNCAGVAGKAHTWQWVWWQNQWLNSQRCVCCAVTKDVRPDDARG